MSSKAARPRAKRRTRAPDVTREKLVNAAFAEIHRHGFQAASLDAILANAGVTKGALYHHFPDKAALGHAVVDEILKPIIFADWLDRLADRDPIDGMHDALRNKFESMASGGFVPLGCPLQNLAQEMSPIADAFRQRVNGLFDTWRSGFAKALRRGQAEGTVRSDIDAAKTAAFIIAAAEGAVGLAKSANSPQLLRSTFEVLHGYLETLRG